jgi:G3E family GTPase
MTFPIPITILTGFLGSGKTTLLNKLLKDPMLKDTAVIVNELGEVGIDHLLVETSDDGIIELSDGCLCCTVRGQLIDTLSDLVDRVQSGKIARLSRVIIETTGLADPTPVIHSILAHPIMMQAFRFDGVLTTIDSVNVHNTLETYEEAVAQLILADRIVMTKTDMENAILDVEAHITPLNPYAQIINALDAEEKISSLFNISELAVKNIDDHHHHHHGIKAFCLTHDKPITQTALHMFLELLTSTQGAHILRMKGIVGVQEHPDRPLFINSVQKTIHPPQRLLKWPTSEHITRLVIIGKDLNQDYVKDLFAAFTGQTKIDTPDAQALRDNPLALACF